jgi:hypothetical protein
MFSLFWMVQEGVGRLCHSIHDVVVVRARPPRQVLQDETPCILVAAGLNGPLQGVLCTVVFRDDWKTKGKVYLQAHGVTFPSYIQPLSTIIATK